MGLSSFDNGVTDNICSDLDIDIAGTLNVPIWDVFYVPNHYP